MAVITEMQGQKTAVAGGRRGLSRKHLRAFTQGDVESNLRGQFITLFGDEPVVEPDLPKAFGQHQANGVDLLIERRQGIIRGPDFQAVGFIPQIFDMRKPP